MGMDEFVLGSIHRYLREALFDGSVDRLENNLNAGPCPPKGELRWKSSLFVWICSIAEVEEIEFGVIQKYRSFPFGKEMEDEAC